MYQNYKAKSLILGFLSLFFISIFPNKLFSQNSISVSNVTLIESQFASSFSINNSLTSSCLHTISLSVPEGALVTNIAANYSITASQASNAWTSEARSYLRVTNPGGTATAIQQAGTSSPGIQNYNLENLDIANNLISTGSVEVEFHLFRTYGGTACNATFQFVPINALTVTVFYTESENNCFTPSNILSSSITENSGLISWEGVHDNYEISYGALGHEPGSADTELINNGTSYLIENLELNSSYSAYVRAVCESGNSEWSSSINFQTLCAPVIHSLENSLSIDFEGCSVLSFANQNQTNKWQIGSSTSNGGGNSIYISNDGGVSNNYSVTNSSVSYFFKEFMVPNTYYSLLDLSFDWKGNGEGTTTIYDYMRVFLVPSNITPVAGTILTPNASSGIVALTPQLNLQPNWQSQNISLPTGLEGQSFRIVFMWRNDGSVGTQPAAAVDNINIEIDFPTDCVTPLNLSASNPSENSIDINWTGNGNVYEISYGEVGHTPGSAQMVENIEASTHTLLNLLPETSYGVYVRGFCEGLESEWSEQLIVETLCGDLIAYLPGNYNQDFENCALWTLVNGTQTNKWVIGSAANNGGNNSIYVSNNNGVENNYTVNTSSTVFFYKDFSVEPAHDEIILNFDWKSGGESSFDYLRVYVMPTTQTPQAGSLIQVNQSLGVFAVSPNLNLQSEWQNASFTLPESLSGSTFRLVFMWRNDGSIGTQPAAAVDNVELIAVPNPGKDIAIESIDTPSFACINSSVQPILTVKNNGTEVLDFSVNVLTANIQLSGAINQTISATVNTGLLQSNEFLTVNFEPVTINNSGTISYSASVEMLGDENSQNNGPLTAESTEISEIISLPTEVIFANYNGGNISSLNPDWNSVTAFTNLNTTSQQTALNQPTVKYNMFGANGNAVIESPYFFVDNITSAYWGAALTKWNNGNVADPMLVGDSVNVYVLTCGTNQEVLIWSANITNNPLTNQIQYFEYSLADFVGQNIKLKFRARTTSASGGLRDNDIHFGEFYVGELPECQRPISLEGSLVETPEGSEDYCINLTWQSEDTSNYLFEIYYGEPGFDPFTEGNLLQTFFEDSITLCGLPLGVTLEFYVRTNCGAAGFSNLSTPVVVSTPLPGETCDLPLIIESLPYLNTGVNTANYGDDYGAADLNGSNCVGGSNPGGVYLNGDDVFFSYTPLEDEVVKIRTFNIQQTWSSLYVMEGCPGNEPNCLYAFGNSSSADRIAEVALSAGVTYNIVVSTYPTPQSVTFDIEIIKEVCPLPFNFEAIVITENSAQLSWGGAALEYELKYSTSNFNPETEGEPINNILTSNYNVSGLESNTNYFFYLRAICEEGSTEWVGPISFQTTCSAFSMPFNETFSSDSPTVSCWSSEPNWSVSNSAVAAFTSSVSGEPYARFNWSPSISNYERSFVSPPIDLTDQPVEGEIFLSYNILLDNFNNTNLEQMSVQWKSVNATNWITLETIANSVANGNENVNLEREFMTLWGAAGNVVQIRFVAFGVSTFSLDNWYLDDVTLAYSPVGISEILKPKAELLNVYPNPNRGEFSVVTQNNFTNANLEVFDLAGKLVYNKAGNFISAEPTRVNLTGIKQGVYLLRITDKNQIQYARIVIE